MCNRWLAGPERELEIFQRLTQLMLLGKDERVAENRRQVAADMIDREFLDRFDV